MWFCEREMARAWGRPMVMKAPDVGYHISRVAEVLPEALFVHINRDLADVACSILKGRIAYYENEDTWLGSYPDEWERVSKLSGREQIAWQVVSLNRMYKDGLNKLDKSRRYEISLANLCGEADFVVESIARKISDMGYTPPLKLGAVTSGDIRSNTYAEEPEYREFSRLIQELVEGPLK